jgi:hypothetical protein
VLRTRALWCARPDTLNDPEEFAWTCDYTPSSSPRPAQALAHISGTALVIARYLIGRKLAEQERLVRDVFNNGAAGTAITVAQDRLQSAGTIESVRVLESQAALAYWSCWRELPVLFPKTDLVRVPHHWRTFGARISPLTGSPRLAVTPPGAMSNYYTPSLNRRHGLRRPRWVWIPVSV